MLNIKKIERGISDANLTKAKLCARTGIARTTLDAILNGSDAKISTIESIARELGIRVGVLFDEDVTVEEYHAHGDRGIAAKQINRIDQRNVNDNNPTDKILEKDKQIEELKNQIDILQKELLKAQSEIIYLMKKND